MTRETLLDILYLLIFVALGALAGWFAGRWYESRATPQATVYVNRFDCSKQGAQEAEELKQELLRRQGERQ